jgi:hypothetical protein
VEPPDTVLARLDRPFEGTNEHPVALAASAAAASMPIGRDKKRRDAPHAPELNSIDAPVRTAAFFNRTVGSREELVAVFPATVYTMAVKLQHS